MCVQDLHDWGFEMTCVCTHDEWMDGIRMAGAPAWQCRSASTLGAFHLYTGRRHRGGEGGRETRCAGLG